METLGFKNEAKERYKIIQRVRDKCAEAAERFVIQDLGSVRIHTNGEVCALLDEIDQLTVELKSVRGHIDLSISDRNVLLEQIDSDQVEIERLKKIEAIAMPLTRELSVPDFESLIWNLRQELMRGLTTGEQPCST